MDVEEALRIYDAPASNEVLTLRAGIVLADEVRRLRALVEDAYMEAHTGFAPVRDWKMSKARAALDAEKEAP